MSTRKTDFVNGEFYHIYNRGVDKRDIFVDTHDSKRFLQSMIEFNTLEPIGSIYEATRTPKYKTLKPTPKFGGLAAKNKLVLVNIIAYCLNPNHFHLILEQVADQGISKFMHKLCGGYSWYFNNKYNRGGTLFQGKFKAKHIDSNEYLLHLSVYVNRNNFVHKIGGKAAKKVLSSWSEYNKSNLRHNICEKKIVLKQFKTKNAYKNFADESLVNIIDRKKEEKEVKELLLELED